jgi:hypothetical protein
LSFILLYRSNMKNKETSVVETALLRTVKLLLDDQHGISEAAHGALMELAYRIEPNTKALEYLSAATLFKGRVFLEEDFELGE